MNNHRRATDSQSVYSINSEKNLVGVKSKRSFFKKHRKKNLPVFALAFIAFAMSVAVVVLSILYAKFTKNIRLCDNEDCMRIAASLKESMNASVDPCDDFYKYACGRWPEAHPSLELSQENNWFNEKSILISRKVLDLILKNDSDKNIPWAVSEARTLFISCMNVDSRDELGLNPLYDLLDELSLPQIPSTITKSKSDFIIQMAKVKRVLSADVFFGMFVTADPKDNKKNIIVLDIPDKGNPFPRDRILEKRLKLIRKRARRSLEDSNESDDEDENSFSAKEKVYMAEVIKQIISNGTTDDQSCKSRSPFSIIPESDIQDTVKRIFELSEVFDNLSNEYLNQTIDEDDIDPSDYMLIDELQRITDDYVKSVNDSLEPKKIWKPFIQELLRGIVKFDPQQKILIADLDYLKDVAVILASTDDELLESTIWWTVVNYCVPYSSQVLRKIWYAYIEELTDLGSERSWSIYCAENVNDLMGMAIAWLFVNPSFIKDGSRDKVREMLENIKLSFSKFVVDINWMDGQTKLATLEKNKRMKSLIGFPHWLFEENELDAYYEGINMSDSTYFDNMLQIIRIRNFNELQDLANNNTDDETFWPLEPTEVNALHTFQDNQIAIPIGILQFPFYGLGLEALNYGAIGTILGHELTHGFDNNGRRFDSRGNFKQWWSNETISRFVNKTTCFIDEYNKYYLPEIDDYIDGELTLSENIADNGGLREAYQAYQIWKRRHGNEPSLPGFTHLTHEQLLFLSYAHMWCESYNDAALHWMLLDSHCPGHVRLKMVLRNSEHFSKIWNCPVGSNMNPRKKCQLW